MNSVFAPGCALMLYKPQLARKVEEHLLLEAGVNGSHLTCCRHEPNLAKGTSIINTCAGCDRRFRQLYDGISTVSLWEVLAESTIFPFPAYQGKTMTVLDACPTRDQKRVHDAVRAVLARMNINIVEPEQTRTNGTCCGDSFYGVLPIAEVKQKMIDRAAQMPAEDVVVYCVSCIKAMHIGGRRPRYLIDLLFGEETVPGIFEPTVWHAALDEFISQH